MRLTLGALAMSCALVLGTSFVAQAADFNPQPDPPGKGVIPQLSNGEYAVLSPQHVLFLVTKLGSPGKPAAPGSYKLSNGNVVVVGKGGVVSNSKSWTWFPNAAKINGGTLYYQSGGSITY
jgi:hypothetical protein